MSGPPTKRISPNPKAEADPESAAEAKPQYSNLSARARRHDYGVRVVAERRDGVVTSQVFADLPAAERKVSRTRERGLSAELHLVRLMPVGIAPLPVVATVEALRSLLDGDGGDGR